ncbi:7002_t:CDS:1, partial [Acaulospora colombiana]
MPVSLLSTQLRRRHHYLGIEPEDQHAYLCLNPDHPTQDTTKVFTTFHKLSGRNLDDLAGSVFYSFDGELVAHVILDEAIQICFDWEAQEEGGIVTGFEWKYLDSKPLPLPKNVYDNVQQASEAQSKAKSLMKANLFTNGTSSPAGEDTYWSRYDNVLPSVSNGGVSRIDKLKAPFPRNGSAAGLSQRSSSPRREDAYWDRYGYGDEEDEAETTLVGAPIAAAGPNFDILGDPTAQSLQPQQQAWLGHPTNFAPEELSQALALQMKPGREGSFDSTRGLFLNYDTPPSGGKSPIVVDLSSPVERPTHEAEPDKSAPQQPNGIIKNAVPMYDSNEKAITDASRALFTLWKSTRGSKSMGVPDSDGEKEAFLSLVSQSL